MTYLIDAWLDHPRPSLRIVERRSGKVCVELDAKALEELHQQGDLDIAGLNSTQPSVLKEQIRSLFLFVYARELRMATD